jgi:hypothetical protein
MFDMLMSLLQHYDHKRTGHSLCNWRSKHGSFCTSSNTSKASTAAAAATQQRCKQ